MASASLIGGGLLMLATGLLLAYVGSLVLRRPVAPEAMLANRFFGVWWMGAGLVIALNSLHTFLALLEITDPAIHLVLLYARGPALSAALCGLLYYLFFLYTGRSTALVPLVIFYSLFLLFVIAYNVAFGPWVLEPTDWDVRLVARNPPPGIFPLTYGLLLAGPIFLAALAYGSLFFRTRELFPRYRIGLVAGSLLFWFGTILVAFVLGWEEADWFPLVYELPGLLASVLVLLAYRPPRWIQRRLRISLDSEPR